MKPRHLLLIAILALVGCDSPKRTVDTLRKEIAEYKADPGDARQEKIEAEFARLDAQIDELEAKGKTAEASAFRSSAENLRADYRAARMVRSMRQAQEAIRDIGDAFKEAGQTIGDVFRSPDATPEP